MSVSQSVSMDSRRCGGCGGCGGCEPGSWRTVVCGPHYQDVRKDASDHHAQHKRAQPREAKLPTPDIHPARELAASVAASAASTGDSMRGACGGARAAVILVQVSDLAPVLQLVQWLLCCL